MTEYQIPYKDLKTRHFNPRENAIFVCPHCKYKTNTINEMIEHIEHCTKRKTEIKTNQRIFNFYDKSQVKLDSFFEV